MVDKLKKLMKANKVRCRYCNVSYNTVSLGIEGTKTTYPDFIRELKKLKFIIVSAVYGKWLLKYTGFDDLEE